MIPINDELELLFQYHPMHNFLLQGSGMFLFHKLLVSLSAIGIVPFCTVINLCMTKLS